MVFYLNTQVISTNAEVNNNTQTCIEVKTIGSRGAFLQSGTSQLSKIGSGLIRASGATNAHIETNISVYVRVERLMNGSWQVYASWGESKNGTSITSFRDLRVAKGYFYRVHCNHYAGSDASSSYTDGLFID